MLHSQPMQRIGIPYKKAHSTTPAESVFPCHDLGSSTWSFEQQIPPRHHGIRQHILYQWRVLTMADIGWHLIPLGKIVAHMDELEPYSGIHAETPHAHLIAPSWGSGISNVW